MRRATFQHMRQNRKRTQSINYYISFRVPTECFSCKNLSLIGLIEAKVNYYRYLSDPDNYKEKGLVLTRFDIAILVFCFFISIVTLTLAQCTLKQFHNSAEKYLNMIGNIINK